MKPISIKPINNDFNLFKNFYYVAKTGSFSRAAQELFVSQPSVSYNVKCLEENLGCKLFHRFSKGVKLTEDGLAVLCHIEKAYNSILLAEKCILNNRNLKSGAVTIGGSPYILSKVLLPTIKKFCKKFPTIKINLLSFPSEELLNFLKSNKIDILIDTIPEEELDDSITGKVLCEKETCFACQPQLAKPLQELNWNSFLFPERRTVEGKVLF